jgi:hypothetical protein
LEKICARDRIQAVILTYDLGLTHPNGTDDRIEASITLRVVATPIRVRNRAGFQGLLRHLAE